MSATDFDPPSRPVRRETTPKKHETTKRIDRTCLPCGGGCNWDTDPPCYEDDRLKRAADATKHPLLRKTSQIDLVISLGE